jgi:glycosyltransferase involved in cell wall biosynthesis
MPGVSVILPTFNRTRFLKLAIESVFAQTFQDWELVIADDGSAADTQDYIRSIAAPRVRAIWLQHCGNPSKVRNSAIEAASGRYLAFLDSDDVWSPYKLERQIAALEAQPQRRWSYTRCNHIDENGNVIDRKRLADAAYLDGWIFEPLLKLQFSIAMPTLVAERELVRESGSFDEQQRFGEFHDICLRLAMRSEVVTLRESLCSVRMHREHYSSDLVASHRDWVRLYQKMMTLAPNPALRGYAARMRAATTVDVARAQSANGDRSGAGATLMRALPYSWHYPTWWYAILKGLLRSV